MKRDVKLIPFEVEEISEEKKTVPEGVKMISPQDTYWKKGFYGGGVVVAILDTGCQTDHPDLSHRIIDGKNFTYEGPEEDYRDLNGHGTHVAGTIAADGLGGILGIAPSSRLLIGKVLDAEGSGSYEGIIRGIHYAINWRGSNGERVRVINMSLGGPDPVDELREAISLAVFNGISVVVAAGNEGDRNEETYEFAYPGAYNEVIEVGAVDLHEQLAYFSNNNTEIDCVAPGLNILSTYIGSRYAKLSGTSMASPHVAGVLALIIEKAEKEFARTLTEAEIYAQLIKNTKPLGYLKSSEGNGFVQLDYFEKLSRLSIYINQNFCN